MPYHVQRWATEIRAIHVIFKILSKTKIYGEIIYCEDLKARLSVSFSQYSDLRRQ